MELPDVFGLQNHHLFGKGVCIHCGVAIPDTKLVAPRCDTCNAGYRALYHRRVAAGLCPRCHSPAMADRVHCERHVSKKSKPRKAKPVIRWGFHRLHEALTGLECGAEKLLSDLWAMQGHGEDDILLEFVYEAESDRDEAVESLFAESGWSRADYQDAASDTMVIGDGRIVRKAVGVIIRKAA